MPKRPDLTCTFDRSRKYAELLDGDKLIATAPYVTPNTFSNLIRDNERFTGASVIPGDGDLYKGRFRENAFEITIPKNGNGSCNVTLADGHSFKAVPMKVIAPAAAPSNP